MKIVLKNIRLWKIGDSYVLTIPKAYITNNLIDIKKKFDVEISEVGLNENKQTTKQKNYWSKIF